MSLALERIAAACGAALAVVLGLPQLEVALDGLDLQALLYWTLHLQVALAFLCRRDAIAQSGGLINVMICGTSVFCMYLADLSAPSTLFEPVGKWLTAFASLLAIWSLAALGRSFGVLPAFRELAKTGPYGVIRHPIYASYVMMDLGLLLSHPHGINALLLVLEVGILVIRMDAEEKVCQQASSAYKRYAAHVRFRLLPGIY